MLINLWVLACEWCCYMFRRWLGDLICLGLDWLFELLGLFWLRVCFDVLIVCFVYVVSFNGFIWLIVCVVSFFICYSLLF